MSTLSAPITPEVLGKPRTGLPDNMAVGIVITSTDDKRAGSFNMQYLLWEYQLKNNGNLIAFWGSPTKQLWVWADCSNRWWTPDITNFKVDSSVRTDSSGKIIGKNVNTTFAQDISQTQVGGSSGAIWSTWNSGNSEWIRKADFCDGGVVPQDDCAKYGINCPDTFGTGKVYTRIDFGDKLAGRTDIITYGIWTGIVGNLTTFHQPTLSGSVLPYHRTVYNKRYGTCTSEPQFDLAYGHDAGSGSEDLGGTDYLSPTNATYGQYRLLCLGRDDTRFKIGDRRLSQIYVVNIRKNRMKERLDEGNIELNLAHLSGSRFLAGGGNQNAHTGSNVKLLGNGKTLRLIDDSRLNFDLLSTSARSGSYREMVDVKAHRVKHGGAVYYMVSGSLERGIYNVSNPHIYGMLYPNLGIMVFDGDKLDASASFLSVTGSDVSGDNAAKMFTAISGAALYTDPSGDYMGFQARRKETQFSEYYFIRVKNSDYNFSNNPTFQTGSDGMIIDDFLEVPKVYFSTIGLYNEQKECIAVGKVTRAIQKTYTTEALFKVRIKY